MSYRPVLRGSLALWLVIAVGCEGRQVDEGRDNGQPDGTEVPDGFVGRDGTVGRDSGTRDPGGNVDPGVVQDPGGGDDVLPSINAVGPIQQSDASVNCPADGSDTDPMFQNGATGLTLDVVVLTSQWTASSSGDGKVGYMVADANMQVAERWRGIMLVVPTPLVPTPFAIGDVLTVTGEHTDYYCNSQLSATSVVKIGTGVVPQPLVIDPAELGSQDSATAEPLEGVLVKVVDVEVIQTPFLGSDGKDHGGFVVTGDMVVANDFGLAYMAKATDARRVGDRFESIVGVVKYSYGKYIVTPRFEEDLVFEGTVSEGVGEDVIEPIDPGPADDVEPTDPGTTDPGTTDPGTTDPGTDTGATTYSVADLQGSATSINCSGGATAVTQQADIRLKPVVVVSPQFSASFTLHGYYVSDPEPAATHSGMLVVVHKDLATAWVPGDLIAPTGDYKEHFCLTQFQATGDLAAVGTADVPPPVALDASLLENGGAAAAEPYEGMVVTIPSVPVTAATSANGWFQVGQGIEVVKDIVYRPAEEPQVYVPSTDDTFANLTGALKFHFEKYRIAPRNAADLQLAE